MEKKRKRESGMQIERKERKAKAYVLLLLLQEKELIRHSLVSAALYPTRCKAFSMMSTTRHDLFLLCSSCLAAKHCPLMGAFYTHCLLKL